MIFKAVILFVTFALVKSQQIEFNGGCPDVTAKTDFDGLKFAGKWYEVERTIAFYDIAGKCITWTFNGGPNSFDVVQKTSNEFTQAETTNNVKMTQNKNSYTASFEAMVRPPGFFFDVPVPYHIIETDYTSYAATFSCVDLVFMRLKFISILSRSRFVFGNELNNAYRAYEESGIERTGTFKVDQLLCSLFH